MRQKVRFSIWFIIILLAAFAVGYYAWSESLKEPNYESGIMNYGQGPDNSAPSEVDLSAEALAEVEGWQTYRNEEYGFEVRYPAEWHFFGQIYRSKRLISLPYFYLRTDKETVYPADGDIVVVLEIINIPEDIKVKIGQEKPASFARWFEEYYRVKGGPTTDHTAVASIKANSIQIESKTFQGREAFLQTYEYLTTNEGIPPIVKELIIDLDGENAFIIGGFAPLPKGREVIKIYDQILSTFRFIE